MLAQLREQQTQDSAHEPTPSIPTKPALTLVEMQEGYTASTSPETIPEAFSPAWEQFERIVHTLCERDTLNKTHHEMESFIQTQGRELQRRLLQGALNQGEGGKVLKQVESAKGAVHEKARRRPREIETTLGRVTLNRWSYESEGEQSLRPKDALLNLPKGLHSHSVRKHIGYEVAKGSYDDATDSIRRYTAAGISKRRAEEIAREIVCDFDAFYAQHRIVASIGRQPRTLEAGRLLVLTSDGKGIVMRHEDLREETRKAAKNRPKGRHDSGDNESKKHRKRRACVASVYEIAPYLRSPDDIISLLRLSSAESTAGVRPKPEHKRVWASIEQSYRETLSELFDEACQRDPERKARWLAIVDGDPHQIRWLKAEASKRGVELVLILDFIHAAEYLWKAGNALYGKGEDYTSQWVLAHLGLVLHGFVDVVVERLQACCNDLCGKPLEIVQDCIRYFSNHREMMAYHTYLSEGYPIASGVIEGACRHLIGDRMERTGAHWSLQGAEAVLKLRSLYASKDYDEYYAFHMKEEFERHHGVRYANPEALRQTANSAKPQLRLVKS